MEPESQPHLRAGHALRAACGYIVIGALFFWPMLIRISTHLMSVEQFVIPGSGGDENRFLWLYWWFQKALSTGHSPLNCDWIWPPTGGNLTYGSIPFLPALLTYPVGRLFGPVVGSNVMVFLMMAGGAFTYYVFLKRTFVVSELAAFCGGALFGYGPHLVWKATGGQYNLIGACWWATCLGAVVTAYYRNAFTWQNALLFAIFLWATFWSSFIEFFMLGITLLLTVALWEATYWCTGQRKGIERRIAFFLLAAPGLISFLILRGAPHQVLEAPIWTKISLLDLIPCAKMSVFSWLGLPRRTEAVMPHSFVYLGIIGVYALAVRRTKLIWPTAIMALLLVAFSVDLFGISTYGLRAVPVVGKGYRYFSRFLPFAFFFLLVFSCYGIDFLQRACRSTGLRPTLKSIALCGLLVFATLELYPFMLAVVPVKHLPLTEEARKELHTGQYCMLIPKNLFVPNHEDYQVTLDVPCVFFAYWWYMDLQALKWREEHYPAIYNAVPMPFPATSLPNPLAEDFLQECRDLRIGFLLFEDKSKAQALRERGSVLYEDDQRLLLKLAQSESALTAGTR
ncbi:MAG: hypothetical protein HZB26_16610 [Candidatus Hydrogenedentes bacterium]|nr:hypothetical protein [Candidatus Hydrogenedentota bacterium]